jgi:hypothetical protein
MTKHTRRKKLQILKKRAETPKPPTMKELTKNFDEFMEGKEYREDGKELFNEVTKRLSEGE